MQVQWACTMDMHDGGFAIIAGPLVTGVRIGKVYWDDKAGADCGLVLNIDGEDHTPDSVAEMEKMLAESGWRLTDEAFRDVVSLLP